MTYSIETVKKGVADLVDSKWWETTARKIISCNITGPLRRDQDFIDDVLGNAALNAIRFAGTYKGSPKRIKPWLYAIIYNEALKTIERKYKEPVEYLGGYVDMPSREIDSPEFLAQRNEDRERLEVALEKISERDRTILKTYYEDELPLPLMADGEGVAYTSMKMRIYRARQRVKKLLDVA